jgi:hypothetical protein
MSYCLSKDDRRRLKVLHVSLMVPWYQTCVYPVASQGILTSGQDILGCFQQTAIVRDAHDADSGMQGRSGHSGKLVSAEGEFALAKGESGELRV